MCVFSNGCHSVLEALLLGFSNIKLDKFLFPGSQILKQTIKPTKLQTSSIVICRKADKTNYFEPKQVIKLTGQVFNNYQYEDNNFQNTQMLMFLIHLLEGH